MQTHLYSTVVHSTSQACVHSLLWWRIKRLLKIVHPEMTIHHVHLGFPKLGKVPSSTNVCWMSDTFYPEFVTLKSTLRNSYTWSQRLWRINIVLIRNFLTWFLQMCQYTPKAQLSRTSNQQVMTHSGQPAATPHSHGEQLSNQVCGNTRFLPKGSLWLLRLKIHTQKHKIPKHWMLPYGHF